MSADSRVERYVHSASRPDANLNRRDRVSEPLLVQPGDGRAARVFDAVLSIKATAGETVGAYSLVEGTFQPNGFAPLPHVHRAEEEAFYVVDGAFDFRVADATVRGTTGSFLVVPRGTLHGFANAGSSPATLIFIHSPGLDGFFVELAELAASGPRDPAKIRSLMEAWGMEVPANP
ncbi:MAG: cupin domain-containing protein [Dehalococcoidia bacterium]